MAIGHKVKKYAKVKEERRQRERLKKFPSIAIADRPLLPVHRQGGITPEEKAVIQLLVQDQPQEISKEQVEMLSKLMRRAPHQIKHLIAKARENFVDNAERYVTAHLDAVQGALVNGEFETAAKHSEWAMENLSHEGTRIIEQISNNKGDGTPKVMIGVNLGGISPKVIDG